MQIHASGELDLASAPVLREVLHAAQASAPLVVLDLDALTFIDSAGLHVLEESAKEALNDGKRLALTRVPAQARRALELLGLGPAFAVLEVEPSREIEPPQRPAARRHLHVVDPERPDDALASSSDLDDEALLVRMSGGDAAALGELYERHAGRAFSLARAICRDPGRAEDAVQEAFLSIWRSPGAYQARRGSPMSWLMTVVRNRAIDVLRRDAARSDRNAGDDELERVASAEDVVAEVVKRIEADHLHALMARLPAAQREVITLAYFGGLTHTQIATQLGLPCGTVKGRIRLGLEKLRGVAVVAIADPRG